MDEQEAALLNRELLDLMREFVPWAVEQVEETIRQGKRVPKHVPRRRRIEMDGIVDETKSLGRGKLAMTQDLTETESLRITLKAVECLLIQPDLIFKEVDSQLKNLAIEGVSFVEPIERKEGEVKRAHFGIPVFGIPQEMRGRISALLEQIRSELFNDN